MDRDPYTMKMQDLFERSLQFNNKMTEAEEEELDAWLKKIEEDYERWCEEEERKQRETQEDEKRSWIEFESSRFGSLAGSTIYPFTAEEQANFIEIIQQYKRYFHKIAVQEVEDYVQAQDAVQEGFYRAYKNLRSYRSDIRNKLQFLLWIGKIVKRCSIDYRERLRAHPTSSTEIEEVKKFCQQLNTGGLEQPLKYVEQTELVSTLQRAIASLPQIKREIVLLRYVYEWREVDVATFLGRPLGTIKKAHHDAIAQLRTYLDKQGVEKEDIGIFFETRSSTWLGQTSF